MRRLRDSEKREPPVSAVKGNMIFARGAAAGVYRVETSSFEFLSLAEKYALHGHLSRWMIKAETNFSIYRVCREYSVDDYVRDTVSMIDERHANRSRWEALLAQQAEAMRTMRSFIPEVYFVISLHSMSWIQRARKPRDIKAVEDANQDALDLLSSHIPARRATTREIQWLLRRACVRGVCEPDVDPHWAPPAISLDGGVWSPGRTDVQSFMPVVTEHPRSVIVEGEDGESLQAMLVMGKPPRKLDYPGSAELLFAPLEKLDFPVDVVAHTRWVPNKKMLTICDNAVKDAVDELEDAVSRFLDHKTKRRASEIPSVQDYFASEPYPPGLETFMSLATTVPNGDQDELKDRIKRLKRSYGSVRLYRPFSLQADLFDEHMLRPDGATTREYRRDYKCLLVAEQLAAMMPIGANQGGSDNGIAIGYTIPGTRRPVKYSPLEASQTNQAGAVLLNGTLGGGKTIAGQLIACQAVKRGSLLVDVDPRPDHSFESLLGDDLVHAITLDNTESNVGLLDPLVVAPEAMREELAASYMMDLLPQAVPEWQTEIISAVRRALRESNPCSKLVIEMLLSGSDQHARAAGKALDVWSNWGLCRLAFGEGTSASTNLLKPATTIKASGLSLPPAGSPRASYDQSERISVATFKLIVAYAMRLISGDVSTHKVLELDEVHAFSDTADGQRFLSRVLRMARSMNVTVLLMTQLIGDLEKLKDLIGVIFAFRQQNADQARANLRLLGLEEDNEKLIAHLLSYSDGRCLMRGLDKRVVAMRFDPFDSDFLRLADTNPSRQLKDLVTDAT